MNIGRTDGTLKNVFVLLMINQKGGDYTFDGAIRSHFCVFTYVRKLKLMSVEDLRLYYVR